MPENSSYVFQIHVPDVMQRHVQGLPYSLSIKITTFVLRQKVLPCSDAQRMSGILKMWLMMLSECQGS